MKKAILLGLGAAATTFYIFSFGPFNFIAAEGHLALVLISTIASGISGYTIAMTVRSIMHNFNTQEYVTPIKEKRAKKITNLETKENSKPKNNTNKPKYSYNPNNNNPNKTYQTNPKSNHKVYTRNRHGKY